MTRTTPERAALQRLLTSTTATPDAAPLIVAAKLRVPARREDDVARPALSARIAAAAGRPLAVLAAPAGYGKTTAVAAWARAADGPVAWVRLDRGDDDPVRLAAHLLAAIGQHDEAAVAEAGPALLAGADPVDVVVPLLSNGLQRRAGPPVALVLDDHHEATAPDAHAVLAAVATLVAPALPVVLVGRTPPPFPLGRLRVDGVVSEIGPGELRMGRDETERFLTSGLGLALSPEELDRLDEQVEGWPGGLALAGRALRSTDDPARVLASVVDADEAIGEYVVEEVVAPASPAVAGLLRRTSVLERLEPELCAAVLDDDVPTAPLVRELRRAHLVTDGGPGRAPRQHRLLRDVLRRRLDDRSPGLAAELHLRVAERLAREHRWDEAVGHALDAGATDRAAELLLAGWPVLLRAQQLPALGRLLERFPAGRPDPVVEALSAAHHALVHATPTAWQHVERLAADRDAFPQLAPIVDFALLSPLAGNVGQSLDVAPRALEHARADPATLFHARTLHAIVLRLAGRDREARELVRPELVVRGDPAAESWRLALLSLLDADAGRGEAALERARAAVAIAERTGEATSVAFAPAYRALGRALVAAGELDEARAVLEDVVRCTGRAPDGVHHLASLVARGRLALAEGDLPEARDAAGQARAIAGRYRDVGRHAQELRELERAVRHREEDELHGTDLSPAELEVLRRLPSDRSIAEIAADSYVSPNTVKTHVRRIYRRLGVSSREDAVAVARARRLL